MATCKALWIFIVSPDTDVYHIGLPLVSHSTEIIVQLSRPSDKHLKLLNLNQLLHLLKCDPHLACLQENDIPYAIQALFVSTGCDYVSFFDGIGKSYFINTFFANAHFIFGQQEGIFTYTHSTLQSQAKRSLLAFLRLIGCAYFKKHRNAFYEHTPNSLLNSFAGAGSEYLQHKQWIDHIRQTMWDRVTFESEMIPALSTLELHWLRSWWVLHFWQQADSTSMTLSTLHDNGWVKDMDGKLSIFWDTETMFSIPSTISLCSWEGKNPRNPSI